MISMTMQPGFEKVFTTDNDRWQAVLDRNKQADGHFFTGVTTTGIYCRPSCSARHPLRQNVRFYETAHDAEQAGFRACKRCRPDEVDVGNQHTDAVSAACRMLVEAATFPDLNTIAASVSMSPSHFHRVFKSLTGLTPKGYADAHRAQRVREELVESESVTSAIYNAGFNSNGRFYANSQAMLGMKPKEYRAGGKGATIRFAVGDCSLGTILVASSPKGVCSILLGDDPEMLLQELQGRFPNADLIGGDEEFERLVATVVAFVEQPAIGLDLPLDIQGTAFQQRVWQKLREIPCGSTRSYAEIAGELGQPTATRAVAQACAANKIAVVIPCHRVVRTDGSLSGYRWGVERKARLLKRERGGDA